MVKQNENSSKLVKVVAILLLSIFFVFSKSTMLSAIAYDAKECVPIIACTLETDRNIPTYDTINGTISGYIYPSDRNTILRIYDGWLWVNYPTNNGSKTKYVKMEDFFLNTDLNSVKTVTLGKNVTVYCKSDLKKVLGETYADDNIFIFGHKNGSTQILYKINGGYKLGFIKGIYDPDTGLEKVDIPEGYYQIKASGNGAFVTDVKYASMDDEGNVQLYANGYATNQGVILLKYKSGYVIMSIHSGKVYDQYKGIKANGTNIMQYSFNGGDNQIWEIYITPSGYYCFKNVKTAMFMDINGNILQNETNIHAWEYNASAAQQFSLESVTVGGKAYAGDVILANTDDSGDKKIEELVNFALSQVGIGDYRGNNRCIYNDWYYERTVSGDGHAWCQVFISYIAYVNNISEEIIKKTNNCAEAIEFFRNKNQFYLSRHYGGNYEPKAGDIVFYGKNGAAHVGIIVDSPQNGYLQVVEGNVLDETTGDWKVTYFTQNSRRTVTSNYVYGYATPDYN